MQINGPNKNISSSDVREYVQDITDRWRHVDELEKQIKKTPDDVALLEQYATAVGEVCYREECLEQCVRNGKLSRSLIAW
jgi:hypothetical protein